MTNRLDLEHDQGKAKIFAPYSRSTEFAMVTKLWDGMVLGVNHTPILVAGSAGLIFLSFSLMHVHIIWRKVSKFGKTVYDGEENISMGWLARSIQGLPSSNCLRMLL